MADIIREAGAIWKGDLRSGQGHITTKSGVLRGQPYSFATRFEHEPGTNPEELIAAAHAACYSMAFANMLKRMGHDPQSIDTQATCTMMLQEGGARIARMRLRVRGQVPGVDEATFKQLASKADKECPVSNLLRSGLEIEIDATLA
jgi:osmotically inducible protein OsmC